MYIGRVRLPDSKLGYAFHHFSRYSCPRYAPTAENNKRNQTLYAKREKMTPLEQAKLHIESELNVNGEYFHYDSHSRYIYVATSPKMQKELGEVDASKFKEITDRIVFCTAGGEDIAEREFERAGGQRPAYLNDYRLSYTQNDAAREVHRKLVDEQVRQTRKEFNAKVTWL